MRASNLVSRVREILSSGSLLQSGLYVGANLVNRALGFVLLALLVATLSPSAFTRYGLLSSIVPLLVYMLSANIHLAPQRIYFDQEDTADRFSLLFSSFALACFTAVLGSVFVFALLRGLEIDGPLTMGSGVLQALVLFSVWATIGYQFTLTVSRILGEGGVYTALLNVQRVGTIAMFVGLVWLGDADFISIALAYLVGFAIAGAVGLARYRSMLAAGRWKRHLAVQSLRFSWPTAIHGIAIWGIASSGRWIGSFFIPLDELASYTLITAFSGVVSSLSSALFEARIPDIGQSFASGDYNQGRKVIDSATLLALALVTLSHLGLAGVVALFGARLPAEYAPSPLLILVSALTSLLITLYLRATNMLIALKRTRQQAGASVLAGILAVIGNLWLVYYFGKPGLLAGLIMGWSLQAGFTGAVAERMISQASHLRAALHGELPPNHP